MPTLRSSRFLRAPENADAISAAAADKCHDDEPHERLRHAERHRGLLHRFDEDLADQRHEHGDAGERGERQLDRPGLLAFLAVLLAAEELAVRLERKQHAERVSDDEQHREAHAQLVG